MERFFIIFLMSFFTGMTAMAQTGDDDIWREVGLNELDYQKEKNYCLRLYGYYRYIDDGLFYAKDRMHKLYRVYEGICELDVRYSKDEDDGAKIMVARNLVHPDKPGKFMEYYELKPYTFLEKARKMPKHFTMETNGDTTRVFTKRGLAGMAVRDTVNQELRMSYNALSPDTAYNVNILILKVHLAHVDADAVYQLDDTAVEYVPQGNLKQIIFEGDITVDGLGGNSGAEGGSSKGVRETFHERTELYVDSVVYLTKSEYRADKKITLKERRERLGYTMADIERLKEKLGVPPLTAEQYQRMEAQRDWDDEYELWKETEKTRKTLKNFE